MVSNASDDLPDPDSPVKTISLSRGSSRSTLRRLCSRAPRIRIELPSVSATGAMVPARRADRTDVRGVWSASLRLRDGPAPLRRDDLRVAPARDRSPLAEDEDGAALRCVHQ